MTQNLLPIWRMLPLTARCIPKLGDNLNLNVISRGVSIFNPARGTVTEGAKLFTEKHEWVDVTGNIGTVGITDYAQHTLGDIVFAQLPSPGDELKQLDECGALESVKAASELYSPVSGKVTDKNGAVEESPGLINSSCYGDGWLFKIELSNPNEVKALMDEEKYKKYVESES